MTRQVLMDAELLERLTQHAERLGDGDAWPRPDEIEGIDSDVAFARLALAQPQPSPSAGEVLELVERVETYLVANRGDRICACQECGGNDWYSEGVQHAPDCPITHLRALAAPQSTPEREALVLHTALHREQEALDVLVDVWEQYAAYGPDGTRSDAGMSALAGVESLLHAAGRIDDEGRVLPAPADAGGEA